VREWPEPVARVASFLRDAGAEARLEEFPDGTSTAKDAARAVGCELGQIVKSLVLDCDGRLVLVLVPGDRRADPRKVAGVLGCARAGIAGAEQVQAATGVEPGGVSPFGASGVERVLVDRTLLANDVVWVGAGSPRHVAAVAPAELVRLTRGTAVDAVQAAA
jgi:prolyl-tRNA editing enzyme YbaK/EbsC (Cys-tRNA(Pro) deacylase)